MNKFKNSIGTRSIRNNKYYNNVRLSYSYGIIMAAMRDIIRSELGDLITFKDESIIIDQEVKTNTRFMKPKNVDIIKNRPVLYIKSSLYNTEDCEGVNRSLGFLSNINNVEPTMVSDELMSSDDRVVGANDKFYIGFCPETINLNMEFSVFDTTIAKMMNFSNGWKRMMTGLNYHQRWYEVASIIPREIIDYWIYMHNLDPNDTNSIIDSINSNSRHPIYYEIVTENNNYEFVLKTKALLTFKPTFTNVSPEVTKKGTVVHSTFVTRGFRVIANIPTSYLVSSYGIMDTDNIERELEYRKNNPITQTDTYLGTGFKLISSAILTIDKDLEIVDGYYRTDISSLWEIEDDITSKYKSTMDRILTDDDIPLNENVNYDIYNDNGTDLIDHGAVIDFTTGEIMLPPSVIDVEDPDPIPTGELEDGIHPYKSKSIKINIYLNMTLASEVRKEEALQVKYRNTDINALIED